MFFASISRLVPFDPVPRRRLLLIGLASYSKRRGSRYIKYLAIDTPTKTAELLTETPRSFPPNWSKSFTPGSDDRRAGT